MSDKVKLIKFLSGEEILAEVVKETKETITFKDAIRVGMSPPPQQGAKPVIGFAAFIPYIDGDITVQQRDVFFVAKPKSEIVDEWKKVFGKTPTLWTPSATASKNTEKTKSVIELI